MIYYFYFYFLLVKYLLKPIKTWFLKFNIFKSEPFFLVKFYYFSDH
jgi:hypothetical protein